MMVRFITIVTSIPIWIIIVSGLRDTTDELMNSHDIKMDEIGFFATINQSSLTETFKAIKMAPSYADYLLLIVDSRRTAINSGGLLPCGYLKLGVLLREMENDMTILQGDLIQYIFNKEDRNFINSTLRIEEHRKISMSYRYAECFTDHTTVLTITGIFASRILSNSSCGLQQTPAQINSQLFCFSKNIIYDKIAILKLKLLNAKFQHPIQETNFILDSTIILIITIIIAILTTAGCCSLFIIMKRFKISRRKTGEDCAQSEILIEDDDYKSGLCYIIANDQFPQTLLGEHISKEHITLSGTTAENVRLIKKSFQSLNYEVKIMIDLSLKEMILLFKNDIRNIKDSRQSQTLVLFILSHGGGGEIFGSCGNSLMLPDLLDPLFSDISWSRKPKLIFFIGCGQEHRKQFDTFTFPSEENCAVVYATSTEEKYGKIQPSFFVKNLCTLLCEAEDGQTFENIIVKTSQMSEKDCRPEYNYYVRDSLIICHQEGKRIVKTEELDNSNVPSIIKSNTAASFEDQYELSKIFPRGLCLIIANDKFSVNNLADRTSVGRDVELLKDTFDKLNYKIAVEKNKNVIEMKALIEQIKMENNYDSIFLFVLTHGANGEIYGSHGEIIEVHNLIAPLVECEDLQDKPKFIFVIGCSKEHRLISKRITVPNLRHSIIVYASTVQESINPDEPTFFLSKLCTAIMNNSSHNENFLNLVVLANKDTWNMITKQDLSHSLTPFYHSTLQKNFILSTS